MNAPQPDGGSFKEEGSRVFIGTDAVYRALDKTRAAQWKDLAAAPFFQAAQAEGRLAKTSEAVPGPDTESLCRKWALVLQHKRIPAISYPYEWTFSMLRDAAILQLTLLLAALDDGYVCQDATPYNVQFIGSRPVFIDITSFVPYTPGETWQGYRQFCNLFLFPLLLEAYRGVSFQPLLRGDLDGISTSQMRRMMRPLDLLRPGILKHVVLHDMLSKAAEGGTANLRKDIQKNAFGAELVRINAKKLLKLVQGLTRRNVRSQWSDYAERESYGGEEEFVTKQDIVRAWVQELRPRTAWDVGCNRGVFSRIVGEHAETVVGFDGDPEVIDALYRDLKQEENSTILPLTQRFQDLSPAMGWRHAERPELARRAKPDLIVMLAVVHHLAITANIPLEEIVDHLRNLGASLLIEFVDHDDEMVQILLRNKDKHHQDYNKARFEELLGNAFTITHRRELKGGIRTLYMATPRTTGNTGKKIPSDGRIGYPSVER